LSRVIAAALLALLVASSIAGSIQQASAYTPQKGDSFAYSETTTVNNGQGSYTGYTDQLLTTGMEQMNSVNGSLVSTSYSYSYRYSNNQGNSTSSSSSGDYTWSAGNFTYVNGTDDQVGFGGLSYSKPLYVWFAMDPSLPVGSIFYVLNSQFTVMSKNYSLGLPTEGKYVQVIQTEGTGQYQRNDSYGVFKASYTWYEYFDPTTGYLVGYNYVEQDSGQYQGQAGGFTYTDDLYVTSTSYPLTSTGLFPNPGGSSTSEILTGLTGAAQSSQGYLVYLGFGVLAVVVIAIYAATRRRGKESLPKRSPPPYTPPSAPPAPFQSGIDLGSKPPEQVVIRDVAMVNCRYCGTLIPSTAERCPYCGGPRR
jgi:hypothetical protein